MRKMMAALIALMAAIALFAVPAFAEGETGEDFFTEWNEGAPALQALIEYVEDVTDEASPNYIPPVDRIATFDMDGTLCAELYPTYLEYYMLARRIFCDPTYEPDEEMLEFGRILRDHALDKSFPDGMDVLHAEHAARAYAGMSLAEFADFITNQLVRDVDGFEGMTYANTFYLPMIEVVEYLQENDFKVYVCSGSDRFLCRTFIEGVLDIPYEQIIGMDVDVEATNEDGADGLKYVYTKEDNIIRTDRLLIKNLKMNKVKAIVKEIGRQPVLSFGNSSGDVSMHNYTIFNNRYKSAAFMLIADDEERDYGNTEKVQPLKEKWEESGYHVISMKDDFRTIYGDDVVKTGTFHWLEEFADREEPGEEDEAVESVPQPQGGKKFERDWATGNGLVQVWYEEEGYRVLVQADRPGEAAGAEWEYACYYDGEKDALVSVSSSRTDYAVNYDDGERIYAEPAYEGFDEEGKATEFAIDEHGCLIWKDGREDAGAGLEFRDIGRFEGVWRNEEEEVEARFTWNGDPDSLFYTVYIQRGKTGADIYALYLMNGFYDPATGKLEADGTCTVFRKNASGEYDSEDDGESVDAFFSMMEDGRLLYETANGIELEYDIMGEQSL